MVRAAEIVHVRMAIEVAQRHGFRLTSWLLKRLLATVDRRPLHTSVWNGSTVGGFASRLTDEIDGRRADG